MTFAVEKWVEQFQKATSDSVFYIFGLGHIAYLEKMREKFQDNVIIIYEPNEENVIRLLQTGQYRVICEDKRCMLLAGEERKETFDPDFGMLRQHVQIIKEFFMLRYLIIIKSGKKIIKSFISVLKIN